MILTPLLWPEWHWPNNEIGDTIDDTKKKVDDVLEQDPKLEKIGTEKIPSINIIESWDNIISLKKDLLTSDKQNKGTLQEDITESSEENKGNDDGFFWKLLNKDSEQKWFPKFRQGLSDMIDAWIITEEEKNQIVEDIKNPEVRESIKIWMTVRWTSILYTPINSYLIAPLVAILGPTVLTWILVWICLYIVKRVIIHGEILMVGKHVKDKNRLSNMSMIPIVWEHMALIELFKTHPLISKYFYALKRTTGKQKKFIKETDKQTKEQYKEKRKISVGKKVAWLEKWSHHLFKQKNEWNKDILQDKNGINNNRTSRIANSTDTAKADEIKALSQKEEANITQGNQVTLELIEEWKMIKKYNIFDKTGKKIWWVDIWFHPKQGQISISDIEINENERNKKYGKATYKELVRVNKLPLVSRISSPESDRVRESLIKEWAAYIDEDWIRILKVQNTTFFKWTDKKWDAISIQEIQEAWSKDLEEMLKTIAYHNNKEKQEKRERQAISYSTNPERFACIVYNQEHRPIAYRLAIKDEALPINWEWITIKQIDETIIKKDKDGKYILPNCAHNSKFWVLENEQEKWIGEVLHKKSAKEIIKIWNIQGIRLECRKKNKKVYIDNTQQTIYETRWYRRICTFQDKEGEIHFIDYKSREDIEKKSITVSE